MFNIHPLMRVNIETSMTHIPRVSSIRSVRSHDQHLTTSNENGSYAFIHTSNVKAYPNNRKNQSERHLTMYGLCNNRLAVRKNVRWVAVRNRFEQPWVALNNLNDSGDVHGFNDHPRPCEQLSSLSSPSWDTF